VKIISYKFEDLLNVALSQWPDKIDVSSLTIYNSETDLYEIKSLDNLEEVIEDSHIGQDDEVLMRNLQTCVSHAIHTSAKHVICIRPFELRRETIREYFEVRLISAFNIEDLGYEESDRELIQKYFDVNKDKSSHKGK